MIKKIVGMIISVVAGGVILSTVALAAEVGGTVSAVDEKGLATIKTTDGKEHQVQITGIKVGDKVDCHAKDGKMSCHKLGKTHK